LGVQK